MVIPNYRNRYFYLLLILFALFHGSSLKAASPVAFDTWSETAGAITSSCPLGYTCAEEINGIGMFQRLMTNASGDRYYQQIIADSGGRDGLMKLEAFILSSNTPVSGLASKQTIEDADALNSFNSTVYIATGWANQDENSVDVHQFMDSTDADFPNVYYQDEYQYYAKRDATENTIGKYIDINQGQLDSTFLQGDQVSSGEDRYTFVNKIANGSFTFISGSISLTDRYRNRGGGGGMRRGSFSSSSSDGTLSWSIGDELQAIWIGNRCDDCTSDSSRNRDYAFQSYENATTGDGIAGQSSDGYAPENWIEQLFGTSPIIINY